MKTPSLLALGGGRPRITHVKRVKLLPFTTSPGVYDAFMPVFTVIVDHEDGASLFQQVEASDVLSALRLWADTLSEVPWPGDVSAYKEQLMTQIENHVEDEDTSVLIKGCSSLWRTDYILHPGEKHLRVLVIKTQTS